MNDIFLDKLKEFKIEFGHCNVPRNYKDSWLANKVSTVRLQYKKKLLSIQNIRELEKMGFVWNLRDAHINNLVDDFTNELRKLIKRKGYLKINKDDSWLYSKKESIKKFYRKGSLNKKQIQILEKLGFPLERNKDKNMMEKFIKEILKYKAIHGNCDVPNIYPPIPWLGNKVRSIRTSYKNNDIQQEVVEELNKLGFKWSIDRVNDTWDWFIEQLTNFKKEFSHCNVPQNYSNERLANKVLSSRQYYRQEKLSKERIKQLEGMGFVWNPQSTKKSEVWEKTLKELTLYKEQHGNCNVPQKYPENQWLGKRIATIRYFKKKNRLKKDQINQLNELGFVWDIKKK